MVHARARGLYVVGGPGVCQVEGCTKAIHKQHYCKLHAKQNNVAIPYARCKEEGCNKHVIKMGWCISHAKTHGIDIDYKKCKSEGCGKHPHQQGYCRACCKDKEIEFVYKRCIRDGCDKHVAKKGLCITHAKEMGIDVVRTTKVCLHEDCNKPSHKKGFCRQHARQQGLYNMAPTLDAPPPMTQEAVMVRRVGDLMDAPHLMQVQASPQSADRLHTPRAPIEHSQDQELHSISGTISGILRP